MKRTRRAALAMMAGSGGLLAADTMGFTQATAERDLAVDVVPDDEAYLALTEDDVAGDLLFETEPESAAVRFFDVGNHLTEPVDVDLGSADEGVRFAEADPDTYPCDRWTSALTLSGIEVGASRNVAISPADPGQDGPISDTVEIHAVTDSGSAAVEADRAVDLYPEDYHAVIRIPWVPCTLTIWKGTDSCAPVLEGFYEGESVRCVDLSRFDEIGTLVVPLGGHRWKGTRGRAPAVATASSSDRDPSTDDLEVIRTSDRVVDVRPTGEGIQIEFVDGEGRERVDLGPGR